MAKKKRNFDGFEIKGFPIWEEKPNLNNTIVDISIFDKETFSIIKKIKKKPTKKALEEVAEILDKKD
jgi:hypothetical protein